MTPERDVHIEVLSTSNLLPHGSHSAASSRDTPPRRANRRRAPGRAPCSDHGVRLPTLVLSPAAGVARGSVGLVRSGERPRWLFCEHLPNFELGACEADKHTGAGQDRRLGAHALVNAGSVSLGDAMTSFRLATRRTQSNLGGAAIDSRAGRSHLPRLVAATIWGSLRSGNVLGAQTLERTGRDRRKGGANPETDPTPSGRDRAQFQRWQREGPARGRRDMMPCAPVAGIPAVSR